MCTQARGVFDPQRRQQLVQIAKDLTPRGDTFEVIAAPFSAHVTIFDQRIMLLPAKPPSVDTGYDSMCPVV